LPGESHVWAFLGDGEMDEPEALGINPEKLDPVAEPKPETLQEK
jgi:hypothetical protein